MLTNKHLLNDANCDKHHYTMGYVNTVMQHLMSYISPILYNQTSAANSITTFSTSLADLTVLYLLLITHYAATKTISPELWILT